MPSVGIELKIQDGGFMWRLQTTAVVEVWAGMRLIGTLTGVSVVRIIEHHLASAALAAHVQSELSAPDIPARIPPGKIALDQRAALRAKRREDRKRRVK